jgi:superfamily II DNA/RNA helicase
LQLTTCLLASSCRRDLAEQTHHAITSFRKYLESPTIRNELLVGGVPANAQLRALKEGVDIITGTPGGSL